MSGSGRILVGQHDGVYLIKLVGDVRVTLCLSADDFIDRMFSDPNFKTVLVDLSKAIGIDSTSLGILAKISIQAAKRTGVIPTLIATSPDIERVLIGTGFEDVFHIVGEPLEHQSQLGELPPNDQIDEEALKERVIDAHRTLMGMNERNRAAFKDLVEVLEAEDAATLNGH